MIMTREERKMDARIKELLKAGKVDEVRKIQKEVSDEKDKYFHRQIHNQYKLHKLMLGNINFQLQMYEEGNFKG